MTNLLISDKSGRIYTHPHLEGMGMKAGHYFRLTPDELVKLPPTSRLFMLPNRFPVGYEALTKSAAALDGHHAVAAFVPPGYTTTYSSAYKEGHGRRPLPLFSYAAVVYYKSDLHVAAVRVDRDRRHDSRLINIHEVRKSAAEVKKLLPGNRLITHLERCAFSYGCPNAQNFFLGRYEAPLPVSPSCNAACAGCISYQPERIVCESQPRIKFVPASEELAEAALFHIRNVRDPIVSFGQGCEGEPLLKAEIIEKAVKIVRERTSKGTININTNGSRPGALAKLFDAGLDSVRVSMNSCRDIYYTRYYKPRNYLFRDVIRSVSAVRQKEAFISLNYLTMPGFTDSKDEFDSLRRVVASYKIDMIQWRNLNFDPMLYFKILKARPESNDLIGIRQIIERLREEFPYLRMGYFNPSTFPPRPS